LEKIRAGSAKRLPEHTRAVMAAGMPFWNFLPNFLGGHGNPMLLL